MSLKRIETGLRASGRSSASSRAAQAMQKTASGGFSRPHLPHAPTQGSVWEPSPGCAGKPLLETVLACGQPVFERRQMARVELVPGCLECGLEVGRDRSPKLLVSFDPCCDLLDLLPRPWQLLGCLDPGLGRRREVM